MHKKVQLINHDCLPILMLLYIMLYIMLACLMLFLLYVMLFVCIMLFSLFFAIDFCKCVLLSFFVLVTGHIACLFQVLTCIMRSAFNQFFSSNSTFTTFIFYFNERAMCCLELWHLK